MNIQEFDDLRARLHHDREEIILAKRPEYTEGRTDVLSNFKQVAAELDLTPMDVWYVYFRKHMSSIVTYVKNPNVVLSEPIFGRIKDAMNYLELLAALAKEKAEQ